MAIVYFCGHGMQKASAAVFVLEDRDVSQIANDIGNSLVDITKFAKHLKEGAIASQLLMFDCCRDYEESKQSIGSDVGEPLVKPGTPIPNIQQMVLFATVEYDRAQGRTKQTSIFAESFLMSMAHAAVDPQPNGWPARSATLYAAMQDCLKLFVTEKSPLQRIDADSNADFVIHQPMIDTGSVQTYVFLREPVKWTDVKILCKGPNGVEVELPKDRKWERFLSTILASFSPVTLIARPDEGEDQSLPIKLPMPPKLFACIEDEAPPQVASQPLPAARGIDGGITLQRARGGKDGKILLRIDLADGPYHPGNPVVSIDPVDTAAHGNSVGLATATSGVSVKPGHYRVSLALPDGRTLSRGVEVVKGHQVTVPFRIEGSRHEWLASAVAAGMIEAGDTRDDSRLACFEQPPRVIAPPGFDMTFALVNAGPTTQEIAGAKIAFAIDDDSGDRFRKAGGASLLHEPLWIGVEARSRRFVLATPAVGRNPSQLQPLLVATHAQDGSGVAPAMAVEDPEFNALFAVLGRRDFPRLKPMLADIRKRPSMYSRITGDTNAIASAGAAIANLAVGDNPLTLDETWHEVFVTQHPSLPDGPIVAARRLWTLNGDRARIRAHSLDAFGRGVPVFALALDWLLTCLTLFPENAETTAAAEKVRAVVRRALPGSAFTLLEMPCS